jgi:hypothetical protein
MTTKKAIVILDWIIANKTKTNKELFEPELLNTQPDLSTDLYRTLLNVSKTDIYNLETVRKQLIPECKHPTKMHDICEGQKYCMACNMDL